MAGKDINLEDEEPTLEIDDGEFSLNEDEPTMHIEEGDLDAANGEGSLDLSDSEVGSEEGIEIGEDEYPPVEAVTVEVPSASSFNALLVISFLAYAGTLAVLLWQLSRYSSEGTFPW